MEPAGEQVVARWSQGRFVAGLLLADLVLVALLVAAAFSPAADVPLPLLVPVVLVELGFGAVLVRLWRRSRYTLTDRALVVPGRGSSSDRIPLDQVQGVAVVLARQGGRRRVWCIYLWQPNRPALALHFLGGLSTVRPTGEPPWDRVAASSMGRIAAAIHGQARSAAASTGAAPELPVSRLVAAAPPAGGSATWFWSPTGEHGNAAPTGS